MRHHRCRYCQQVFQPAAYHPHQRVCSNRECQRQRRSDYHRQKIASDPVYQQVCLESPRKWRRANPDYWKKYRQDHPQQVERNRREQRWRDQKRRLANLANNIFVRSQVLVFQWPDPSGPASPGSCKQHPSGITPAANLIIGSCSQNSSNRARGFEHFGIVLAAFFLKSLLKLYLRRATAPLPLANISERRNTSFIGPTGTAYPRGSWTCNHLLDSSATWVDAIARTTAIRSS